MTAKTRDPGIPAWKSRRDLTFRASRASDMGLRPSGR
jgi:hypothetical protein